MATLNGLLYTARDALGAQSYGLNVTGQNIANANTPLYARRDVTLQTRVPGSNGGVEVQGTRQAIDKYADARLFQASSFHSAASERDAQLSDVESVFNDFAGTGLGDTLGAVFSSFETLSTRPSDPVARAQVLAKVDAFASRVRDTGDQLATKRSDLLTQAKGVVEQINVGAEDIASLNKEIKLAQGAGTDPSSLIDRRNQKLQALSELVDVKTLESADGSLLVQAAGGTLVDGGQVRAFEMHIEPDGSFSLAVRRSPGAPATDITSHLSGGKLAGIKEARDTDLFEINAAFDQFAFEVSTAINSQHGAGVGLDGSSGRRLFDVTSTADGAARSLAISSDVAGNPDAVAASSDVASIPGGADNASLLAGLASAKVASGNALSPGEAYAGVVGAVGMRKASAANNAEFREAILAQSETFRESTSGVSLDEEMVALTQYERGFQAASKVLSTVDELLRELIERLG